MPRMSNELVGLHLVTTMCNRKVKDVGDVLLRLEFSRIPPLPCTRLPLSPEEEAQERREELCQDIFEALLKRYLRGHGHPECPELRTVFGLTPEHCAQVRSDATLRCQVFLHTLTSSPMLPVEPDWKLKVSPVHVLMRASIDAFMP